MRLYVLKPIRLKKAGRVFSVSPGAIVEISKQEKAKVLIDGGYVRPLLPPDESGKVQAARIYSNIPGAEVWVVTHPEAISYIPDGEVYFLPEEVRYLKDATPNEIRMIYQVKKELGSSSILISVNAIGKVTA